MLIQFLQDNNHAEIAYTVSYKEYYIVIRQITPIDCDWHPWFCCYVNKKKADYTDEELHSLETHCGITWDGIYRKDWAWSELTGKPALGWDYDHGLEEEHKVSVRSIIKDAHKVIDNIEKII